MENKYSKVIEELTSGIFPKLKDILVVFLYGSVARGDFSLRHSDLDLLIILKSTSISEKMKEKLINQILPVGYRQGVKIHPEFQGLRIRPEDRTLLEKMIEEGEIIYSSGIFTYDHQQIGLQQYFIYEFSLKKSKKSTLFSKTIHGRKSWYWKGNEKVVKTYPGIIDGKSIMELGRGAIMVCKDKEKDLKHIFDNFGVDYKLKKMVYGN